jgi:hypothetical protein
VAAAAVLSLALGGSAVAAKPKTSAQTEKGKIAVPFGSHREGRTGPYPMFEDRSIANGTTLWAFKVDRRTLGKRFTLEHDQNSGSGSDISTAGGDAYAIVFYDAKANETATINNTYGGFKPETGIVPADAAWATVVSEYGLNMSFLYRAG